MVRQSFSWYISLPRRSLRRRWVLPQFFSIRGICSALSALPLCSCACARFSSLYGALKRQVMNALTSEVKGDLRLSLCWGLFPVGNTNSSVGEETISSSMLLSAIEKLWCYHHKFMTKTLTLLTSSLQKHFISKPPLVATGILMRMRKYLTKRLEFSIEISITRSSLISDWLNHSATVIYAFTRKASS